MWYTVLGPIFEKERRVASRRRRLYVLRFTYVFLFATFLALSWLQAVATRPAAPRTTLLTAKSIEAAEAYHRAMLVEFGKKLTEGVVTFQFWTLTLVGIFALGTSISEEVSCRTLGVLLSTPLTAMQIVLGKLAGALIHVVFLLAISIPVLLVLRVFGGVPWEFVLGGVSVTLTFTLFAACVSMVFSMRFRKAYLGILVTASLLAAGLMGIPVGINRLLTAFGCPKQWMHSVVAALTPPEALRALGDQLLRGGPSARWSFHWSFHCLFMLLLSRLVVYGAVRSLGRYALIQEPRRRTTEPETDPRTVTLTSEPSDRLRRVWGPPVWWKEVKNSLLPDRIRMGLIIVMAFTILIGLSAASRDTVFYLRTHIAYLVAMTTVAVVVTAVLAVTSISTEKEGRTWPVLLSSALTDREIILGKFFGVMVKCLPLWCLAVVPSLFYLAAGAVAGVALRSRLVHPIVVPLIIMIAGGALFFAVGIGVWCGVRFRRSSTGIAAALAVCTLAWGLPLGLRSVLTAGEYVLGWLSCGSPIMQLFIVGSGTGGSMAVRWGEQLSFVGPAGDMGPADLLFLVLFVMSANILLGVFFAIRAAVRVRRTSR